MPTILRAEQTSYVIDGEDRLVDVSEAWCKFARANQGQACLPKHILGQCLWRFIAGMDNRLMYSRLLQSIRARPRELTYPFRCDSPSIRRDFRMHVEPGPHRCIRFTSETIREHRRPTVRLLMPSAEVNDEIALLCSWCMRVEIDLRRWVDLEEADQAYASRCSGLVPRTVHTICPGCAARMTRLIQSA